MPNEDGEKASNVDEEIIAEDIQPRRVMPTPVLPSQAEIDEHNIDHIPYRVWCDSCVCGRGQEVPHLGTEQCGRHIAIVSFDYF